MKKVKVLIPLQLASTRVKLKNIRPFYGEKSLFDVKMEQLLKANISPDQIYISSEADEILPICEKYGCHFMKRPMELTGNAIKQPELIGNMLSNLPCDDDDILWVQVTNPLFDKFNEMLNCWDEIKSQGYDSIVAVKTVRHHMVTEKGIPVNFNFGYWHKVSQDLPKFYELLWSAFLLKRETIEKAKYHIGMNPYYMPFDDVTTVDIDTNEDFNLASIIYKLKVEK